MFQSKDVHMPYDSATSIIFYFIAELKLFWNYTFFTILFMQYG